MRHRLPMVMTVCLLLVPAFFSTGLAQSMHPAQLSGSSGESAPVVLPTVLQGSVRQTIYDVPVSYQTAPTGFGQVVRAMDGQPAAGVTVRIPALRWGTLSDAQGRFQLPALPSQPVIAMLEKEGFRPASVTLDRNSLAQKPLLARLEHAGGALLIDSEIHHLGDGSYAPGSAGAGEFRRQANGPVLRRSFVMPAKPRGTEMLEIGSVLGLDTLDAHRHGQSRFHRASTNMRVLLNGRLVGELSLNGDRRRLPIPAGLLQNGVNTLEIQTGFQSPDGVSIDFDDVELTLLSLVL